MRGWALVVVMVAGCASAADEPVGSLRLADTADDAGDGGADAYVAGDLVTVEGTDWRRSRVRCPEGFALTDEHGCINGEDQGYPFSADGWMCQNLAWKPTTWATCVYRGD